MPRQVGALCTPPPWHRPNRASYVQMPLPLRSRLHKCALLPVQPGEAARGEP